MLTDTVLEGNKVFVLCIRIYYIVIKIMMMKYVICVAILAVSLRTARALSSEEVAGIHEKLLPHIIECSKELGIEKDAVEEAKEKGSVDGIDSCFFACVFKKAEIIDDKGMFVPEKALEKAKGHVSKEEDIQKASEIITECTAVNTEDVNDGDAGCDRSKLLVTCFLKNKQKVLGN